MKMILPFLIGFILIPIMVDMLIFGNSVPSNLDNAGWASFLGSFWGAIIGGGCTCWAVIIQKHYTDKQRKEDEVTQIRPYMVANIPTYCKMGDNIELHFFIKNIGLNSACDIELYAIDYDCAQIKEKIEQNKYCLAVKESVEVNPKFDFSKTQYYEFHYLNLKNNRYCQEFRYDKDSNSFRSFEPKIIKKQS